MVKPIGGKKDYGVPCPIRLKECQTVNNYYLTAGGCGKKPAKLHMPNQDTTIRYATLDIDGVAIFYREAGPLTAPAILLLHGFPSSSHMFRDLIPALSGQFHVIAPDYPGFGYSGCPSPSDFSYTFDHLSLVMEKFIDAIGLRHCTLYLQDYGGPIGFRIASRRPALVEALIIQNANAYTEGLGPGAALAKQTENDSAALDSSIDSMLSFNGIKAEYTDGAGDAGTISPDAYHADHYFMNRSGSRLIQTALFKNYHTNFPLYPLWQQYLKTNQPPALIVWGKNDAIFMAAGAAAYTKDLPGAELHLLEGGHFVLEEYPRQIAGLIQSFMNKQKEPKLRELS